MRAIGAAQVVILAAWVCSVLVLSVAVARLTTSGRPASCREPARSADLVVCFDRR